jgi:uncharacterized protein YhaN
LRFEAIALENYGAFATRSLELGAPGLTIVYGPNEAGKSTFLEAIGDFLFGVPHNSPRVGLFGVDAMRIAATLTTQDGRRLSLRRRKGRNKTLTDEAGAPVDDSVLAQLLGSTSRERFESLFGLDHEALREGGEHLLSAQGDIGRLIVEAGGGLRTLMARLDDIDAEPGKLFSNRRSGDRAFYQALDAFTVADKAGKASLLTRDAYEKLRKARAAAHERLVALRDARRALAAQSSALERAIRVSPLLVEHGHLAERLETFADVAHLEDGFSDKVTAALAARETAARQLGETAGRHRTLTARLAALEVDPRLTAIEADLLDIAERLAVVRAQRADRPNRLVERAQYDARLAALRRRLKLEPGEDLAPHLPSPEARDEVQGLAAEALTRAPALAAAREQIADLADTAARLRDVIAKGELLSHDLAFGMSAADLAALPSRAATLEVRRRQARTAADAVGTRCQALGFDALEALGALPCPQPEALQTEIAARAALEGERTQADLEIARATTDGANADAEIARLAAGGEVPTDAVLTASRSSRDEAWAPIRASHLGQTALPPISQAQADVAALEAAVRRADDVVDRRAAEAQRIAALVLAEQQRGVADRRAETARKIGLVAATRLSELADGFAAGFPALVALRPDLAAVPAFLEARRQTLDDWRASVETGDELERLEAELQPLQDQLAAAERRAALEPAAGGLSLRVAAATAAISAHDEAHREHRAAAKALSDLEPRLASERRKADGLTAEDKRWIEAWAPAVQRLGAAADISPASASDLVTQWASAEGIIAARAQTQRRLDRMDEDARDLRRLVAAAGTAIGLVLPDDEIVAAQMLDARWREHETVRTGRGSLEADLPPLAALLNDRERDFAETAARVRDLAALTGDPGRDEADLRAIGVCHAHWTETRAALVQLETTIATAGDGLGIDALREECAERPIDTLRADLAAVATEDLAVAANHEEAVRAEQNLAADLAGQEDDAAVAHASVQREAATAQMHEAVERYVELTLARALVIQAIAKVRAEQQDPLIQRAGDLFKVATTGEFVGLDADIDRNGQPAVVGVRASGGQAPVAIMSDGTRDQLFLAFRLASIEAYCRATEPLPFIADDILVHVDDPRSAATLELLAEFARKTQVILFTHEQAVATLAEPLIQDGHASLVELDGVGGALSQPPRPTSSS